MSLQSHRISLFVDLVNFVRERYLAPLNTLEAELKAKRLLWLGPSSKLPIAAINVAIQLAFQS